MRKFGVNSNALKIVACASMFIDHMGLLFFPNDVVFRAIGRLAAPLFAFCIGVGAMKTRSKLKYFLRVFILGLLCQSAYVALELLSFGKIRPNSDCFYLNILLTFSLSIAICSAYLSADESAKRGDKPSAVSLRYALFVASIAFAFAFDYFCSVSHKLVGINVSLDYGLIGVLLPLTAAITANDLQKQKAVFTVGVVIFTSICASSFSYAVFALASLPFIWAYNGERGKLNLKYAFYLFYPLHLAALYLANIIVNLLQSAPL